MFWDLLLTNFGVSWVFPFYVRETLLSWHGSFVGKGCKKAWMAASLCIFWIVWCGRNRLVFDNVHTFLQDEIGFTL